MANVVLLNTGGKNYTSLQAAFMRLGAQCQQSTERDVIQSASHIVLPGVGSAEVAMQTIRASNLEPVIKSLKQPVLGICLGMQILFEQSEESNQNCLGIVSGHVIRMSHSPGICVPHMGWNTIQITRQNPLFENLDNSDFYFIHSYAAAIDSNCIALAHHGDDFCAAINRENFYGVQFHPERSGMQGQQLLENFLRLS